MSQELWRPGSRPGLRGVYEECGAEGEPVRGARRVTLRSDRSQLPPTSRKGLKWRWCRTSALAQRFPALQSLWPRYGIPAFKLLIAAYLVMTGVFTVVTLMPSSLRPEWADPLLVAALVVLAPVILVALLAVVVQIAKLLLDDESAGQLGSKGGDVVLKTIESKLLEWLARPAGIAATGALSVLMGGGVLLGLSKTSEAPPEPGTQLEMVNTSLSDLRSEVELVARTSCCERRGDPSFLAWVLAQRPPTVLIKEPAATSGNELVQQEVASLRRAIDLLLVEGGRSRAESELASQLDQIVTILQARQEPPDLAPLVNALTPIGEQLSTLQSVTAQGVALEEEQDRRTLAQRALRLLGAPFWVNQLPVEELPTDFDLYYNASLVSANVEDKGDYSVRKITMTTNDPPGRVWDRWSLSLRNDGWRLDGTGSTRSFVKSLVSSTGETVNRVIRVVAERSGGNPTRLELTYDFVPGKRAPRATPVADSRPELNERLAVEEPDTLSGAQAAALRQNSPDQP